MRLLEGRSIRLRDGRKLTLSVVDALRDRSSRVEWARKEVIDIQSVGFANSEDESGDAREAITSYVDSVFHSGRYDVYNRAAILSHEGRPAAIAQGFVELIRDGTRTYALIRGNLHVRPEFRAERLTSVIFAAVLLPYLLGNSRQPRESYYTGDLMSPLTYHFLCRRTKHLYPSLRPPRQELMGVYRRLRGTDEVVPVSQPVRSLLDERAEEWLRTTKSPHIKYYLQHNPDFRAGFGLSIVSPVTRWGLIETLWRTVRPRN